ncbi:MAG: hypothetical protein IAG10_21265 [Planctomycetaceae bacterium]|nr:hypothetical protein [Planctomycetaceae bacterium]
MKRSQLLVVSASMLVVAVCGAIVWSDASRAVAQTGTSKSKIKTGTSKTKTGDSKELDSRAEKNLEGFITDTIKLAEDYEKAKLFEEAQDQLRTVARLKPELPGLKEKIDKLNEAVFETNDFDMDLDVADSWKAQVQVFKGKSVRVEAPGNYKITLTVPCDANGLPTKDPRTDMAVGVRCGALMGIVVPTPEPGGAKTGGRNNDKIGEPFEVGASKEFTPKEDGILLLNVNLPSGHKSIGKLRVHVSGHIKLLPKELR